MNRIRIINAIRCDVPLEILLAVGRFDPTHAIAQQKNEREDHDPHHGHGAAGNMFDTWSYESDQPFSLETLREMAGKDLPTAVYRCKGIVFAADSPNKRVTLQVVGRRTEISELDEWRDRTPGTQIVAIGASITTQELSGNFDACIEQQLSQSRQAKQ